jgi:hypothetical protein
MKIPQTHSELLAALATQIDFLHRSSAAFDAGHQDEAIRLATHVRVLVHQTSSSHALLAQLGLLESLAFVDTAIDSSVKREIGSQGQIMLRQTMSPGVLAGIGLAMDGFRFSPLLGGENAPRVSFAEWWEPDLVPATSTEKGISRKWLVLTMTNQGGGAHVDPSLDARYAAFLANRAGLSIVETSPPIVNSVAHVAMRQIAHEILLTLNDQSGGAHP